ncbi:hypothetical protein ACFHWV_04140 [Micromonospora sp. LOL_028]|uniref:hypothetical protein n=1 Tax=Micromonospora sp. LOL_028 TaxID=3345420 RepID=UPI003A85569A
MLAIVGSSAVNSVAANARRVVRVVARAASSLSTRPSSAVSVAIWSRWLIFLYWVVRRA